MILSQTEVNFYDLLKYKVFFSCISYYSIGTKLCLDIKLSLLKSTHLTLTLQSKLRKCLWLYQVPKSIFEANQSKGFITVGRITKQINRDYYFIIKDWWNVYPSFLVNFFQLKVFAIFFLKASTDHFIFTYLVVLLTDEVVSACEVSSGQFYLTDTALKL